MILHSCDHFFYSVLHTRSHPEVSLAAVSQLVYLLYKTRILRPRDAFHYQACTLFAILEVYVPDEHRGSTGMASGWMVPAPKMLLYCVSVAANTVEIR